MWSESEDEFARHYLWDTADHAAFNDRDDPGILCAAAKQGVAVENRFAQTFPQVSTDSHSVTGAQYGVRRRVSRQHDCRWW